MHSTSQRHLHYRTAHYAFVTTIPPHKRLQRARELAGFETASDAARSLGVREPTYLGHENGSRGFRSSAEKYARRYGVNLEWLLTGRGAERFAQEQSSRRTVPVVGTVEQGARVRLIETGSREEVLAPSTATAATVALEIQGDSLGDLFDRWLLFFDDVRTRVRPDSLDTAAVCGLRDGRILIRKVQRSKSKGLYHLLSQQDQPILDIELSWAVPVLTITSR